MLVLGIDPAMCNTGWQLLEDTSVPYTEGKHTLKRLAGGTITQNQAQQPTIERLLEVNNKVQALVQTHKPDLIGLEGALEIGANRSTTGAALYSLLVSPWHPLTQTTQHKSTWVVTISPVRLNSAAYGKSKTTGKETVDIYRKHAYEATKKLTQHEADAYWLGYLSHRFLKTCLTKEHPDTTLIPKERSAFLDATKKNKKTNQVTKTGMLYQKGLAWWENTNQNTPTR